ncbi:hypothetical protein [Chlamydiifrater volucris]|uniref:hypothetical protein n=1 Tax=Chlamydiifrater volucris TaxID=2681470 RepID=UPI0032B2C3EB
MSAPSPPSSPPSSIPMTQPTPLKEQINNNFRRILWLISRECLENIEHKILCSQIESMFSLGFSYQVIARALTASKISLGVLMKNNSHLSANQYDIVVTACEDLSEASGSSSSSATKSSRKRKAEEEPKQGPSTSTTEGSDFPTLSKQPCGASSIITLFLDTVLERKIEEKALIPCPQNINKDPNHVCSTCTCIKDLFSCRKPPLIRQTEKLLEYTEKKSLSEALSLPILKSAIQQRHLGAVDVLLLIDKLGIGDAVRLPNEPHPTSCLGIYLSMDKVIKSGMTNALTRAVTVCWKTPSVTPSEEKSISCLFVSRGNTTCGFFRESLESTFLKLRILVPQGEQLTLTDKMPPLLAVFSSRATFLTLCNLLKNPLGEPFILRSDRSEKIVPWSVVEHVYSLILSIMKKICIPKNKISAQEKLLSFPPQEASELSTILYGFADFYNLRENFSSCFCTLI